MLGGSIASSERAEWGFQNRTDLVTLATGERVVVQRYRRREDAEYRVRLMRGLHAPAARSGIAIPPIREADPDADPPWVAFGATGLLDFESVRLADPLFDVAWWSWSVSFGPPGVLASALPGFLEAAGVDVGDPDLEARLHVLQVLRMCELLAGDSLDGGVRAAVEDRLRQAVRSAE